MLVHLDLQDALAAMALLQLQRSAYQQEAALIGYPDLPPLHETLPALMDCGETLLGWREDGQLCGALGYTLRHDRAHICRLVVAPTEQRRGLAKRLLNALFDELGSMNITVSTAVANYPAIALYAQHGFVETEYTSTPDGLSLVTLHRTPDTTMP